jgi:hypothetical protein
MIKKPFSRIAALGIAMALIATPVPATANGAPDFEGDLAFPPTTAGYQVQEMDDGAEALPNPNAVPSDEGTVLVTWYGHESGECFYYDPRPRKAEFIKCVTLFQVFDADGTAISPIRRASDESAPWYYGAPQATWNPVDREWAVYWTSYNDVGQNEGGVYLRRVSAEGEVVGDVVSMPNTAKDPNRTDDPDTTEVDESLMVLYAGDPNPSLLWLGDGAGWLMLTWGDDLTGPEYVVTHTLLDSNLRPTYTQEIFTNTGIGPYGVFTAVDSATGRVLVTYINEEGTSFKGRVLKVVNNAVQVSDEFTVVTSGAIDLLTMSPGVVYVSSQDKFAFSFVSRLDSKPNLNVVYVSVGDAVMQNTDGVSVSTPVKIYESPLSQAVRSWLAFDSESGLIYASQTYRQRSGRGGNPWYSISVLHTIDSVDLSLVASERIGEDIFLDEQAMSGDLTDFRRSASRPSLAQTGDSIAFAYVAWSGMMHDSATSVRFGVVTSQGPRSPQQPAASAGYNGPTVQPLSASATAGSTVRFTGTNLGFVSRVEIDGQVCEIVSHSAGELVIKLPRGLTSGPKNLVITSDSGVVTIQNALNVLAATEATTQARPAVKRLSQTAVKVWVFEAFGAGKVQILLNGKEVGWVNASDASDAKLRDGRFVRTLTLAAGKNVIQVLVDGKQVSRTVYSN